MFTLLKPKSINELNLISYKMYYSSTNSSEIEITDEEIIEASNQLSAVKLNNILTTCRNCKSIKEVTDYARDIMNEGYPIDNIIYGICKLIEKEPFANDLTILTTEILSIIRKNGDIFINFSLFLAKYWTLVSLARK